MSTATTGQGKLPAFQLYPGDALRDPGFRSLTYHDQGVWFAMLCFMHESSQRGKLVLNGRAMSHPEMSRLLGLELAVLESTVDSLLDAGVCSIDEETGALMSRRMVRDEEGRQQRKMWGRDGGRSAAAADPGHDAPGFLFLVRRESDGKMRLGTSVNPVNRMYRLRFDNRGETLILLGKRAVSSMRQALSAFTRRHLLKAHEWFDVGVEKASFFLSSFLSSSQEDEAFLPPSSVSSSSSELSTERERAGGTPTPPQSDAPAYPPADDLHPLVAQIILAHPRARLRNWTVRDIPVDACTAVLAAVQSEASDGAVEASIAGRRILQLVQGIARGLPEGDWRFLKDIVPFFAQRDYRLSPELLVHRKAPPGVATGLAAQASVGMYREPQSSAEDDRSTALLYWERVQQRKPEAFARDAPMWVREAFALKKAG